MSATISMQVLARPTPLVGRRLPMQLFACLLMLCKQICLEFREVHLTFAVFVDLGHHLFNGLAVGQDRSRNAAACGFGSARQRSCRSCHKSLRIRPFCQHPAKFVQRYCSRAVQVKYAKDNFQLLLHAVRGDVEATGDKFGVLDHAAVVAIKRLDDQFRILYVLDADILQHLPHFHVAEPSIRGSVILREAEVHVLQLREVQLRSDAGHGHLHQVGLQVLLVQSPSLFSSRRHISMIGTQLEQPQIPSSLVG
mmetsp:Transcript_109/g.367  ORF Transcript_109/g.367 Transcript_109/m.367 type:complete len:252 (-) Transcript_109:883-1638(-)